MRRRSARVRSLDLLIDEREISRRIVEFARAMDRRDWKAILDIFSSDATADLGSGLLGTPMETVSFMRSHLDKCGTTQHLVGSIVIDVDGRNATSLAYVSDTHLGIGDNRHVQFRTLGDYRDEWEHRNGRWKLVHRSKDNRGWIGSAEIFDR